MAALREISRKGRRCRRTAAADGSEAASQSRSYCKRSSIAAWLPAGSGGTNNMGSKSQHTDELPKHRPEYIETITRSYSTVLGEGGYGIVYKGTSEDGEEIAVKVLHERIGSNHDVEFTKEFYSLLELRHKNIILLVGYCYETEKIINNFTKKFDEIIRAALCFEYAPYGNLGNYISDKDNGLDWYTHYKIIKGTCEGLHYLHHHPGGQICHLDLKPENILLSGEMVPKISDFGMSRLFNDKTTKITQSPTGTWKYQPLEFKTRGQISIEFDIFSLGVIIIEMVVGPKTYNDFDEYTPQELIKLADKKWRPKLRETEKSESLEAYCQQVKTCLEIGLLCVEIKRHRPKIANIISRLNEVEQQAPIRNTVLHDLRKDSGSLAKQARSMTSTWTAGSSMERHRSATQESLSSYYWPTTAKGAAGTQQRMQRHTSAPSGAMGSGGKVVLYVTTMGGIPKTFDNCNTVRAALHSCNVVFEEKDLFDRPDNLDEVKKLLADTSFKLPVPILCINGRPVGGSLELRKLCDEGRLAGLFKKKKKVSFARLVSIIKH